MRRLIERGSLVVVGGVAVGAFAYAAYPRIFAWNSTASAATIAQQRAASCTVVAMPVALGMRVVADQHSDIPLPPGTFVCDRKGGTAEVGTTGRIRYIKSAPAELINEILAKRGLGNLTAGSPVPAVSPKPPKLKQGAN